MRYVLPFPGIVNKRKHPRNEHQLECIVKVALTYPQPAAPVEKLNLVMGI